MSLCVATDSSGNVLTSTNPTAGTPAGSAATWTVKHVDTNANPGFGRASCVSTGASTFLCAAADHLGNVLTSTDPQDGASATWSVKQVDSAHPDLSAVSCTDTPSLLCVTVDGGGVGGNAVISTDPQDGASATWTTTATGLGGAGAVSCASTSLCVYFASGSVATSTDPTAGSSSTWTTKSGVGGANSRGISCLTTGVSTFMCVAEDNSGAAYTTTDPEDKASATWTFNQADSGPHKNLQGISCVQTGGATFMCVASDAGGAIVVSDNPTAGTPSGSGATWAGQVVDGYNALQDVSCVPSASLCVAVDDAGNVVTSTDPQDGPAATWTVKAVDSPHIFRALACASSSLCVAVDDSGNAVVSTDPGDGASATWTVKDVGDGANLLLDISCTSAPSTLCVAVDIAGNAVTSSDPAAGVPAGSGATWNVGSVGDGTTALLTISCPSTSLCVIGDNAGKAVTSTNPDAGTPPGSSATWHVQSVGDGTHALIDLWCVPGLPALCVTGDNRGDVVTSTDPTAGAPPGSSATWSLAPTGLLSTRDLSCPSTSLCVVVGGARVAASTDAAAGTPPGSGANWDDQTVDGQAMVGISCSSSSLCMTVDARGFAVFGTRAVPQRTLTVSRQGNGDGTVSSAPAGINCGPDCAHQFDDGNEVTLTATPAPGSSFAGWSGDCSGQAGCQVTMTADRAVTATFVRKVTCTLKPNGSRVTARAVVTAAKRHRKKPPKGVLKLTARCDQAAMLRLTGTITARGKAKHGKKPKAKTFATAPISRSSNVNTRLTLAVKLPKAASRALKKGATESAAFQLTATNANGTSTVSAKVARLRLAR